MATPLSLQATKMDIGVRRVRRAEDNLVASAMLRDDSNVLAAHEVA